MSLILEQKPYTPPPIPTELVKTSHSASATPTALPQAGWISGLLGTVPSLIEQFNYRGQKNNVEIARYEAEKAQAESNYNLPGIGGVNKNYILIGVAGVIVIALIFIFKNK